MPSSAAIIVRRTLSVKLLLWVVVAIMIHVNAADRSSVKMMQATAGARSGGVNNIHADEATTWTASTTKWRRSKESNGNNGKIREEGYVGWGAEEMRARGGHRRTPEEEEELAGVQKIGSRPPSCKGKCKGCAPCSAVEITVPPAQGRFTPDATTPVQLDQSPYYSVAWRCRCKGKDYNP